MFVLKFGKGIVITVSTVLIEKELALIELFIAQGLPLIDFKMPFISVQFIHYGVK